MQGRGPRINAGLALEARDLRLVRALDGRVPRVVLDVARLEIPAQAHAALVGPAGSGKTQLLRTLVALERPARGSICWGAINVAALDRVAAKRWQRETVGLTATAVPLLQRLTARQNLLLPERLHSMRISRSLRDRADVLLDGAGIAPDARLAALDAADIRCLEMARALLRGPAIVIADEPTRDLSDAQARRVEERFRSLDASTGSTMIIATRDLALGMRFDVCFELADFSVRAVAGAGYR